MKPEAMQALMEVLALTPAPPGADADPADVLATAHEFAAAREGAIWRLREIFGTDPILAEEGAAILKAIEERDSRWQAGLQRARHELMQRVEAARKVRRRIPSSIP